MALKPTALKPMALKSTALKPMGKQTQRAIATTRQRPACVLSLLTALILASCGGRPADTSSPSPAQPLASGAQTAPATASPNSASPGSAGLASADKPAGPIAAPTSPQPPATPISPAAVRMTTVTVYQADDQCVNFVPEQVQVPADRPMQAAVGKVLEKQGDGDFDLGGYRVSLNAQTGEATVDLRLVPGSKRQIVSLSACEQFALFGSLRETLMKNSDWNVKSVRFTERGEEIVL
ncbi:sporulation/spore germination protein [Thermoleptolyngbya sp.]